MRFAPRAVTVLLTLSALACGTPKPPPSPSSPGVGPVSGGTGSGGLKVSRLPIEDGVRAASPRFSPDGQRLVWLRSDDAGEAVAVSSASGTGAETLATGASYLTSFAWKGDGSAIYYSGYGLYEIPSAGGSPVELVDAFASMNLDVSPDGETFVYTVNGTRRLTLVDFSQMPALQTELEVTGGGPRFSPDGTKLAFHDDASFKILDLATNEVTDVATGAHFFSSLDWFADGERLVIVSEEGIELLDLSASPPTRRLLEESPAVMDVDLSPDGKKIVYGVNGQAPLHVLTGF